MNAPPCPSAPLEALRAARRSGNLAACLEAANACVRDAETTHDPLAKHAALNAVGMMYVSRGEPQDALPWFTEARETAIGGDLRKQVASSHHQVYMALCDANEGREAFRHALLALEAYETTHQGNRVVMLVADLAQGYANYEVDTGQQVERSRDALRLFRSACLHTTVARERLVISGNCMAAAGLIARAEPMNGKVRSCFFEANDALEKALQAMCEEDDGENASRCLRAASIGCARLGNFERAAGYAEDARRFATGRGESILAQMADEALCAAQAEHVIPL